MTAEDLVDAIREFTYNRDRCGSFSFDLSRSAAVQLIREAAQVQVCGACGEPWSPDQRCGQAANNWPFPVCYPRGAL